MAAKSGSRKKPFSSVAPAVILVVTSFFVYLFTAAPFMLWLDAPRFVSGIVTMGVPNPPEPLYLLLAKPFTFLPLGSYIFRIQVFSALTAALALFFIFKITLRTLVELNPAAILQQKATAKIVLLSGIFSLLVLGFSYQFWSQAQNIETFVLVVLIEVVTLFLLFTATTRKAFFINFCLIALILGLATGTNPVLVSIVPAIVWVMWRRRNFISSNGFGIWLAIGVIAVVAVHLYIPIRAATNPFLNYWRATDFENVWNVSTGAGLNVYVPELGRINGFTGSPEVFFKSTWHFIEMLFIKFTPLILPFILAGSVYLWKKSQYYFIFWFSIIVTNWLFAGLYFSGNQESWFLVSDVAWVVLAGLGFFALATGAKELIFENLKFLTALKSPKYLKYSYLLFIFALIPLIFWFPTLNRRGWNLTEDYIKNLYKPIGNEKAIIFGSSDLFDSVSFYVHDVPCVYQQAVNCVYKPNTVPITDNLFYIFQWYRDNLTLTNPDLKMPDGSKLKYDSANEYSQFVSEFFKLNKDKYKIYITTPAMRNNFLQVYEPEKGGEGGSLKIAEEFKLVPQGLLFQLVDKDSKVETDQESFNFQFSKGFPKEKPWMLEQTYTTEMTGLINEYAYSFEYLGDQSLQAGKVEDAFKFYQAAYEFNPKNAEIISRLGNYYGNIGNHQKAAEFFEKALKIEPKNVGLLFNLAIAYEGMGKKDKAIVRLNEVLKLSVNNPKIGQLAKDRIAALKGATPSAEASSSAFQPQALPPGATPYQNEDLNIQLAVPKGFSVSEEKDLVKLSNGLNGKDELTFWITGRKMKETEGLEALTESLPYKIEGIQLASQPITIPGFQALGKTYGTGEHLTFLLLMRRNDQGWVLRVYPGDSNKNNEFNQILSSMRALR